MKFERLVWSRLRSSWRPVAVASVGAALAWLIAHRLLGHAQPFFAPIAAAVALSSSGVQRGRRSVQLVGGVLLGIAVGELISSAFGTGTIVLGAIAFVTMTVAVVTGTGFVGEGLMFVNQAAASAILVVALHRHGTGAERALDAIIGGTVALVLGVGLFPAEPMGLLADAEGAVLLALARALETTAGLLERDADPEPMWAVQTGHEIHQLLARLTMARSTAEAVVRVAPRRFAQRALVDAESSRSAQLDLLANAVLSLIRAATRARLSHASAELRDEIASLGAAIGRLAEAQRPWSAATLDEARSAAQGAVERTRGLQGDRVVVVASILAAAAVDLERVIGNGSQLAD